MVLRHRKTKKKLGHFILVMLALLIVFYFFYHTIRGERGWFAMLRLEREIQTAENTLTHLKDERSELEHLTSLLKNDSLDPDLLDEKSRELLNYSNPNEIVILTPEEKE